MWFFGVGETLKKILSDPQLRKHALSREHRTTDDSETFWGSDQYKELNKDTAGAAAGSSVLMSIGGDGLDLNNWGRRTATVWGLKIEDLPAELVQKGSAVAPLVIVEGPQEPANVQPVNELIVAFFKKHQPSADNESAHCCSCLLV